MATWSAEQVLALAPDPGSAKAGRGLASLSKWVSLGASPELLWGECQGSGASPYQTKIDLREPAFHCSCPSRKFPCKHALGLFLLWATQPAALAAHDPPAWVTSWMEARTERAEKKVQKARERQEKQDAPETAAEAAARRKREQSRLEKIGRGLNDLKLWLSDLLGEGLASLQSKSGGLWDDQARRLIDAQAPGLARRVRQVGSLPVSGSGWETAVLDHLARIHLLVEGWRQQETLPTDMQAEIRGVVGLTADQGAVQAGDGVRDVWQVVGQRVSLEDRLKTQRTWLIGQQTRRPALVLDFAHGSQPLDTTLPPGSAIDAELAFFPAALPLRALVKSRLAPPSTIGDLPGHATIASAYDEFARALARTPWLDLYPVVFEKIIVQECEGAWMIRDSAGAVLPLVKGYEAGWHLLAMSGGHPFGLAAQFDGEALEPMSCWLESRFWALPGREREDPVPPQATLGSAGLASAWAEIVASASVGLDRRPLPQQENASPLQEVLAGLEAAEPASRLMGLAAATSWYSRVGRKPSVVASAPPAAAAPDELPPCGPAPVARLARILGGEHLDELPGWLALLAEAHQRIPERFLPEVLAAGARNRELRPALRPVLGQRGRWLALQNRAWSYAAGKLERAGPEAAWQTGTRAERIEALIDLRASIPERARELLVSTWDQEPSADRAEFLKTFETGLSMADEPWLESLLDERTKPVRKQAAELLARLPESRLCQRMIDRARPCLFWNGKAWQVTLPEACDVDVQRDGIEPKPEGRIGERAWWLQQVVARTPLGLWCESFQQSPTRLIQTLAGNEWAEEIWTAWVFAALRQNDREWAFPLLLHSRNALPAFRTQRAGLWALTDPQQRDAFLVELLRSDPSPLRPEHPAFAWLAEPQGSLGPGAGREVIHRLKAMIAAEITNTSQGKAAAEAWPDYQFRQFVGSLGGILPIALLEEAEQGMKREELSQGFLGSAYQESLDHIRFRFEMRQEFFP